jgi:hypothetical protein
MYLLNETDIDNEVDIPAPVRSLGGVHIAIKSHERNVHRFLEWLEGEGLVICQGAMPQSPEKIKELYHEFQYTRRGLCVPSAS